MRAVHKPRQTVDDVIRDGAASLKQSHSPALDARVLMKAALGTDDAGLIANGTAPIADAVLSSYRAFIERRQQGEPVAYITGEQEFWSLPFKVTRDVLIPRGDSECLIEAVIAHRARTQPLRILDLGTGSGCLLCALLTEFPQATGLGIDRSPAALEMARSNAHALGLAGRAAFVGGDWGKAITEEFDIILANPPYIPEAKRSTLAIDVVGYEPHSALFAGADGLDAYREIIGDSPRLLRQNGILIMEVGEEQAADVEEMVIKSFPTVDTAIINDLADRMRGVLAFLA